MKYRLEQLDEFDESSVRKTMGLSQQEYVSKINMLNEEIKKVYNFIFLLLTADKGLV